MSSADVDAVAARASAAEPRTGAEAAPPRARPPFWLMLLAAVGAVALGVLVFRIK